MKKRFLQSINLLLGIVSMTLAGCHTHKNVATQEVPRPMLKYGVPPAEVRAMYGVPSPEVEQQIEPQAPDTVPELKTDSVPQVICLYGVPPVLNQQ